MRRLYPLALLALAMAAGCASTSDVKTIDSQVSELQEQVAELKKNASSKEEVQSVNTRLAQQTQTLLKSNADLSVKVNEVADKMQNTQGSIEQTNYRIDRLVQQMTQIQHDIEDLRATLRVAQPAVVSPPTGGMVAPPAAQPPIQGEVNVTAPALEDPMQAYQASYRDYQRGNYDLAIGGFQDFLTRNPQSDLADNATYWIAESLYSQKKYRDAIEKFDLVVSKYPHSDKVPASLLKKGYGYINLGEKAQGVIQLQYVLHEHPASQEAALARQKLRSLGIETK